MKFLGRLLEALAALFEQVRFYRRVRQNPNLWTFRYEDLWRTTSSG